MSIRYKIADGIVVEFTNAEADKPELREMALKMKTVLDKPPEIDLTTEIDLHKPTKSRIVIKRVNSENSLAHRIRFINSTVFKCAKEVFPLIQQAGEHGISRYELSVGLPHWRPRWISDAVRKLRKLGLVWVKEKKEKRGKGKRMTTIYVTSKKPVKLKDIWQGF